MTPFRYEPPRDGRTTLIHVPHAGTQIPDDVRDELMLDDEQLGHERLLMTDHATDRISDPAAAAGAGRFVNHFSRLVIDPERFTDDEQEEMAQVGMGAVYTRTSHGERLRDRDDERRQELLDRWFHPYAEALTQAVEDILAEHGRCTIIDLHSYPSQPLPYEIGDVWPRPEVCIGTDPTHTPAELVDVVEQACRAEGLDTVHNVPFAGTYVPTKFFGRDPRVRSVMLEIRRDTYLDESTGESHDGLAGVQRLCAQVAAATG